MKKELRNTDEAMYTSSGVKEYMGGGVDPVGPWYWQQPSLMKNFPDRAVK